MFRQYVVFMSKFTFSFNYKVVLKIDVYELTCGSMTICQITDIILLCFSYNSRQFAMLFTLFENKLLYIVVSPTIKHYLS